MARTRSSIFDMELNVRNNFKEMITDTDVLQKSVKNLAKTASFNVGSPKDVSEMLSTTVKLNNALAKSSDLVTGAFDLSKFNSELKNSGLTLNQVYRDLNAMGQEGRAVFSQLTTAISTAETPLKRSSNLINGLGTSLKNTAGWLVASSTINTVAKSIQQAFNYAQNLDKSLNNIQIVTGHSAEYMKDFAIQANKAAKELNASTLEYTNAALIYYQQGLSDQEVAKRTATTVRMAQVTGDSMAKVSSQMTSIWNNFSTGIDNLERYGDVMANLGAHTASSSREIASGLEKFAAIGNTIGLSYDYAATAMATIVAQSRQSADSVGTSLKTLFSRLESLKLGKTLEDGVSLNKYSEALMKVGVNVLEANGKLRDMDSILNDLGKRWDNLTKAQQVALAQTVGGVRNYTTLVSLMENWETFQENLVTAQTAEGTLQRQADIYATSWEAAQKRVKTSAETIYNTLISSDFFKGLNNIGATILDQLGEVGKTLGTSGSLSGLGMIAGKMFGEQIAGGIDNALHNISVMTPSGFKAANLMKLESMNWLGNINTKNPNFFTSNQMDLNSSLQDLQKAFSSMSFSTSAARNLAEAQIIGAQNLAQESLKSLDAFQTTTQTFNLESAKFRQSLLGYGLTPTQVSNITAKISGSTQTTGVYAEFQSIFQDRLLEATKSAFGSLPSQTDGIRTITNSKLISDIENYLTAAGGLIPEETRLKQYLGNTTTEGTLLYKLAHNQILEDDDISKLFTATSERDAYFTKRKSEIVESIADDFKRNPIEWRPQDFNTGGVRGEGTRLAELARNGELDFSLVTLTNSGKSKLIKQQQREQAMQNLPELIDQAMNRERTYQGLKVQEDAKQIGIRQSINEIKNSFVSGTRNVSSLLGLNTGYRQAINEKGQFAFRENGRLVYAGKETDEYVRLMRESAEKDSGVTIENATASIGEFGVAAGMAAQSTAMAISSVTNFAKSVEKGEATFTGFATTLGSVGMMVGQNLSLLQNNTLLKGLPGGQQGALGKGLGSLFNKMGATGLGGAEGITMAGAGVTAAVVAAAAASIYSLYQNSQLNTLENRTIKDQEINIQASSIAKEDRQKFDAFEQAIHEQQASVKQLSQLQQGTAAYTSALLKANEQARTIIDTYDLQAGKDYTIEEGGVTTFSAQQISQIYEKVEEQARNSAYNATLTQSALDMDYSIKNLKSYGEELQRLIPLSNQIIDNELQSALDDLKTNGSRAFNTDDFRYFIDNAISPNYQNAFSSLKYSLSDKGQWENFLQLYQEGKALEEIITSLNLSDVEQENLKFLSNISEESSIFSEEEKGNIEQILQKIDNEKLAQEANFQTAINAYVNQDNKTTAQEKAIARSLTIGEDKEANLEKYLEGIETDQTRWEFGFIHKTDKGEVFGKSGQLLTRGELDEQYRKEFGSYPKQGMSDWEVATQIRAHIYSDAIEKLVENNKGIFTGANISDSTFSKFANSSNLSLQEIYDLQQERGIALQPSGEKGSIKITEAGKLLLEPVFKEYSDTLYNLNNTLAQNSLMTGEYLSKIVNNTGFSANQLTMLNSYTSTMGANFGDSVGKYVFETLTSYKDGEITGWNQEFVKVLDQLDLSNSITGLASIMNQATLFERGNSELSNSLQGLKNAINESIEQEGGLAKAAFNTSDMQQVVNTVASALISGTNITTGDIAKLAKKNATLASYLALTGSDSETGTGNYQSVIDISKLIATGQIKAGEITPGLVKGIEILGGTADAAQAGLETLEEQNLGTSYGEIDKYYQNIGIAWATATKQDLAHDQPFLTAMREFLTEEQFSQFYDIMESMAMKGAPTKDINTAIKNKMPELYTFLSTTAGKGKYFGKGGGGIETAFQYFGQLFGDTISPYGLNIDEKTGNLTFNTNFAENYEKWAQKAGQQYIGQEFTQKGLETYLTHIFGEELKGKGYTYSPDQVSTIVRQMTGYFGSASTGYLMDLGQATSALNASMESWQKAGYLSSGNLDALLNSIGPELLKDIIWDEEEGKFRSVLPEEKEGKTRTYESVEALRKDVKKDFTDNLGQTKTINKVSTKTFSSLDNTVKEAFVGDDSSVTNLTDAIDSMVKQYSSKESGNMYYDYDALKTFFTDVIGYEGKEVDKAMAAFIDNQSKNGGTQVAKVWTDGFGNQHTIRSEARGETSGEQIVQQVNNNELYGGFESFLSGAWDSIVEEALGLIGTSAGEEANVTDFKSAYAWALDKFQKNNTSEDTLEETNTTGGGDGGNPNPEEPDENEPDQDETKSSSTGSSADLGALTNARDVVGGTEYRDGRGHWQVGYNVTMPNGEVRWFGSKDELNQAIKNEEKRIAREEQERRYIEAKERQDDERNATPIPVTQTDILNRTTGHGVVKSDGRGHYQYTDGESTINFTNGNFKDVVPESLQDTVRQATPYTGEENTLSLIPPDVKKIGDSYALVDPITHTIVDGKKFDSFENAQDYMHTSEYKAGIDDRTERQHQALLQQDQFSSPQEGQYINPFTGEKIDKTTFDQMYSQIKQIAENTGESVELANELNEAVGSGEAPGLTGETNKQNQPVDENGNPVDENGNPIDFGEEKQNQTSAAGGGGVGDSGKVGGPSGGNGNGQDDRSPWQVVNDALNNGDIKDGDRFVVDGVAYNAKANESGILEIKDDSGNEPPTAVLRVSGQNNNLIPKFASGLNEPTIAMTGELGPELRIRADGTMDLLGKHGREYNWVEPTDKIYTAAQTTSILGDKKIKEMIHFANGINNFIPGFDGGMVGAMGESGAGTQLGSSGGGGGGRPTSFGPAEASDELENHRYDPNWLKYRDILERYYTILQQMENLANALARVAELADRAWGKQRQEAITETIKLQEQQIEAQKRYLSEINTYLSEDRGYLTSMIDEFIHDWNQLYPDNPLTFTGAQFDKNGVLLNYRELTEAMVDAWNMSTAGASYARNLYGIAGGGTSGIYTAAASGIGNADFSSLLSSMKGLLGLEDDELSSSKYVNLDPQTKLEEQMKDIQFYTETLNLLQQQQTVLQQMYEQLLDTRLQQVQVELQYKITLKDNALALLDYQLSQVKNDAYSAADAISLITDETLDTMSRLDDYADSIRKMFNVNVNGYADYDNWIVKMSDDTEQLTKDLTAIEDLHQKFWDEESQSYRDKYKLDEEGNIVFPEMEEEESGDLWSRLWHSDPYDTLEGEEHTFDEYSKRVMKLYEKYYNIYSSYLPNPDEFLEYIDSKNEDDAGLLSFASLLGEEEEEDTDKAKKAKRDIANYEEALKQLQQLAAVIEDHSLYVDIDKFTSEIKNIDDVREQLQNIYEDLSQDFDGIENKIKEAGENLLDEAGKVVINSYADVQKLLTVFNEFQAQRIDDDAFAKFLNNPEGFFADISDLNNNFDFQNFTAQEIETLKGDMSQFLNFASQIKGNMLSQVDTLGSSVKTYFKNIETEFAKFDNFKNLFNNWQNIIDLTGRSVTKLGKDIINAFSNRVIDNSLRKLESSKDIMLEAQKEQLTIQERYNEAWAQYESYSGEDENRRLTLRQYADEMKDQLDKVNKEAQEAQETFMNSWKESLEALQTEFEKNVKFAATVFEEGFSPYYQSLDMLSTAINREQQLKDLYLTSYQQAHDLSKLNRDIQQSIIDTDNLNSKRELRKIQKEVNDLQASGVKLSSYDLDLIQKKYDLELARQALEDAKNAKSLVRLTRDNNGNWGYVYTANQDDIDEAEQNYEDAILAMEQANEEYLKNLENQLVSVWTQAEQEIAGLNTDDALYYEHVKEITDVAMQNIDFIKQQFNNAIGGNEYLENNVSGKAREIMQGLTTGFSDTILSAKTDVKDLDSIITTSIDNINQFADDSINAYSDFITRKAEVWQTAGKDIKDVAGIITSAMDEIDTSSQKAMGDTAAVLDRVATAFTDMIDKFDKKVTANLEKFLDAIAIYEKYGAALEKFIAASGEYIAERTYNLEGGVNDWSKLEKIYDILATDGKVWIKYIDETGAEVTKVLEASTEDTMAWLANAREYLVNIFQAMTGTTAEFETQQALDEFYNGIVDEYNDKGALNLNVTKGLLKAIIEAEDNDLKEYLTNKDELTYNDEGKLEEGQTGYLQLRRENEEEVQKILELLKEILQVKVASVFWGGGGSDFDWYAANISQFQQAIANPSSPGHAEASAGLAAFHNTYGDTGLYTGNWQGISYMDTGGYTGMYTGEWPDGSTRRNGRLAWLHQKELVLNAHDTENFLDAMEIVRQLDNLTNWMANGLDIFAPQYGEPNRETLQQEVTIHAEFPNVVDHSEIEQAMDNLVNMASQYVNRR